MAWQYGAGHIASLPFGNTQVQNPQPSNSARPLPIKKQDAFPERPNVEDEDIPPLMPMEIHPSTSAVSKLCFMREDFGVAESARIFQVHGKGLSAFKFIPSRVDRYDSFVFSSDCSWGAETLKQVLAAADDVRIDVDSVVKISSPITGWRIEGFFVASDDKDVWPSILIYWLCTELA